MRIPIAICGLSLVLLAGCGLENMFSNSFHDDYDRPASKIRGKAAWAGAKISQISVTDSAGNPLTPFLSSLVNGVYELRLPSTKYNMLVVHASAGNVMLRAIVPSIGEESVADNVDLDAVNMTETLLVEAKLAHDGDSLTKVTGSAYVGTRNLIRGDILSSGPTNTFYKMVVAFLGQYNRFGTAQLFFVTPEVDSSYAVKTSPIDPSFFVQNPFDYTGSGTGETSSARFDAAMVAAAKLYRPPGCPDPAHVRVVFTADFNDGALSGNCQKVNKFLWATNKPGKQMYFVGWTFTQDSCGNDASEVQDAAIDTALGNAAPNNIPMYDDGTNGDEVAGDGIWTVAFNLPYDTGKKLRIGYKYTWGFRGAVWTGSEEWPGNSRILEVVDDGPFKPDPVTGALTSDHIVYRRDVFGDEATNKDCSNGSFHVPPTGGIDWKTDLHGCGSPDSHESTYDNATCKCKDFGPNHSDPYPAPPPAVVPLNVACSSH